MLCVGCKDIPLCEGSTLLHVIYMIKTCSLVLINYHFYYSSMLTRYGYKTTKLSTIHFLPNSFSTIYGLRHYHLMDCNFARVMHSATCCEFHSWAVTHILLCVVLHIETSLRLCSLLTMESSSLSSPVECFHAHA